MFKSKTLIVGLIFFIFVVAVMMGLWFLYTFQEKEPTRWSGPDESPDQIKTEIIPAVVDKLASRITFYLMWSSDKYSAEDFNFYLQTPSGIKIETTTSNSQVKFSSTKTGSSYQISNPESGEWQIIVESPVESQVTTSASTNSNLKLGWNFTNSRPQINDDLAVEIHLTQPEIITTLIDIQVNVKKYKSNLTEYNEYNLILQDNGQIPDQKSNDGIYTVDLSQVTGDIGSCCVEIKATGYTEKAGNFSRFSQGCTYVRE